MKPQDRRTFLALAGVGAAGIALFGLRGGSDAEAAGPYPVRMSDAEWRKKLGPDAFNILRRGGTEPPYSSPLNDEHRAGIFACKGCGQHLYSSNTKFESHTGWPSFWAPLPHAVQTSSDHSLLMARTEVHCARCGGHLGHVFDDGPPPTGKRYCMDGLAMVFHPGA